MDWPLRDPIKTNIEGRLNYWVKLIKRGGIWSPVTVCPVKAKRKQLMKMRKPVKSTKLTYSGYFEFFIEGISKPF